MLRSESLFDDTTDFGTFDVPPFSVVGSRGAAKGERWHDRKRYWNDLGIRSEIGRDPAIVSGDMADTSVYRRRAGRSKQTKRHPGPSVFDPVLCELAYRWFCPPGGRVLDPFAGGSVRGIVASRLGFEYVGVDIRPDQISANRQQLHLAASPTPTWVEGDARNLDGVSGAFDFIFTCPPYGDMEQYSADVRDLSAMEWPEYVGAIQESICVMLQRLRSDRFAAVVVSDVRDPSGVYRRLPGIVAEAFSSAGAGLYNEVVYLQPIASAPLRSQGPFIASRKVTRTHQLLLVFVKGNARRATAALTRNAE